MKCVITIIPAVVLVCLSYLIYSGFMLNSKVNEYDQYLQQRLKETKEYLEYIKMKPTIEMAAFLSQLEKEGIHLAKAIKDTE